MITADDSYESAGTPNTGNATTFDPKKAPEGYREDGSESYVSFYKSLELLNRGTHVRYNNLRTRWNDRSQLYKSDNMGIFNGVASQLDLRPSEKRWGRKVFAGFDFKKYSQPGDRGMGPALSAFCLCSYIRWKNGGRTHPNHKDRDIGFKDIQSSLGFTDSQVAKRYGRIENEIRRGRGI